MLTCMCLEQTILSTGAREPEPVWPSHKSQAPGTQQLNFRCMSVWGSSVTGGRGTKLTAGLRFA